MFIDSHCHLNFEDFGEELSQVLQNATDQGIEALLSICCTLEEAESLEKIANQYPQVFCTVGVHPHEAKPSLEKFPGKCLVEEMEKRLQGQKVIGIGECGLDFYYENSPREDQEICFRKQLELAERLKIPLCIHTREAEKETIKLLSHYKVKGVIHCFSGTQWLADAALDLGFYISLSGIVTFKKADSLRKIVQSIPLDRLLLETDAPFLAPIPYRGKRNEPAFLIQTALEVARLKEISVETLSQQTTRNFYHLYSKACSSKEEI